MGSLFEGLIRSGEFVLAAGATFEATVVTNNSIRVKDGELLMQGRHVKLDPGAYVDLAIENGEQGLMRHDLIVARYTKNAETGIEECSLVVIKGTAVEGGPVDPEHMTGDINAAGALQNDLPLYRVPISGLNVGELEQLFEPQASLFDALLRRAGGTMYGDIDMAGHKVTGLGAPTAPGDAVPMSHAAPAGFGLGGEGAYVSDLDTLTKTGVYTSTSSAVGNPFTGWGGIVVVLAAKTGVTQTMYCNGANGTRATRHMFKDSGKTTFEPWEYENPRMAPNTEYRTTDRYNGKPVYKKLGTNGDILWRVADETAWRLQTSADYVAAATVE
jgi:hypothetical protein